MNREDNDTFVLECEQVAQRFETLIGRIETAADKCAEILSRLSEMYSEVTGQYREFVMRLSELAETGTVGFDATAAFDLPGHNGNHLKN